MKTTFILILSFAMTAFSAPDHSLYTAILSDHVKAGQVDYQSLRRDERLPCYLKQLAVTDLAELSSYSERLAFWLNAYNAYTLKLIVDRQPINSITEIGKGGLILGSILKTTAWDIRFAEVGGKLYTLNEIEHEIIRRQFQDSRAHFALNCASGSCPVLRTEAYNPAELNEQLDDQAREFIGDHNRNRFDLATKTAWLSSIFSWYKKDFGQDKISVLMAAAQYAPAEIRQSIDADPSAWKVKYLSYDWSLNSVQNPESK